MIGLRGLYIHGPGHNAVHPTHFQVDLERQVVQVLGVRSGLTRRISRTLQVLMGQAPSILTWLSAVRFFHSAYFDPTTI